MNLPVLAAAASLPSLDSITGAFSSFLPGGSVESSGDEIVALMVFLYDLLMTLDLPTFLP